MSSGAGPQVGKQSLRAQRVTEFPVAEQLARKQRDKEPLTCMSILFYTLFGLLLLHVVLYLCVFVLFISDVRITRQWLCMSVFLRIHATMSVLWPVIPELRLHTIRWIRARMFYLPTWIVYADKGTGRLTTRQVDITRVKINPRTVSDLYKCSFAKSKFLSLPTTFEWQCHTAKAKLVYHAPETEPNHAAENKG